MMANWCSNTVVFDGKSEAIKKIQELFNLMGQREAATAAGQLPDFVEAGNGGWLFNIYLEEGGNGQFQYETKWAPNTDVLLQIAVRYGVDFVHDYEELGFLVYGRASFCKEVLRDWNLEEPDFESYREDGDTGCYLFEGEQWESEWEILEVLLERRISRGNP